MAAAAVFVTGEYLFISAPFHGRYRTLFELNSTFQWYKCLGCKSGCETIVTDSQFHNYVLRQSEIIIGRCTFQIWNFNVTPCKRIKACQSSWVPWYNSERRRCVMTYYCTSQGYPLELWRTRFYRNCGVRAPLTISTNSLEPTFDSGELSYNVDPFSWLSVLWIF